MFSISLQIIFLFHLLVLSSQQYFGKLEIVSDLQPEDCYKRDPKQDYKYDDTSQLPKCGDFLKSDKPSCSTYNSDQKIKNNANPPVTYADLINFPTCEKNGDFAAKQCKGQRTTGRCFCFNKIGQRIFGQEWWKDADDMTCACSRRKAEMAEEKNAVYYNSLHCNSQGNYEALQCDVVNGLCWCADEKTGNLVTPVVPDKALVKLPCYKSLTFGVQYLRQCESQKHAQNQIIEQLRRRGTSDVTFGELVCDDDGSYGAYTVVDGSAYCTWRDNTKIGSWQYGELDRSTLNCNCARDSKIYSLAGKDFSLACDSGGNYKHYQQSGKTKYCVDDDGFRTTNADISAYADDTCIDIYPGYNTAPSTSE